MLVSPVYLSHYVWSSYRLSSLGSCHYIDVSSKHARTLLWAIGIWEIISLKRMELIRRAI